MRCFFCGKEELIEKIMDMTDSPLYGHYIKPREGVMIDNQLIKNRSFYREHFLSAELSVYQLLNGKYLP